MPKSSLLVKKSGEFYETNKKRFKKAFTAGPEWFMTLGDSYEPRTGDLLVHQDNGKRILIVCHTDFVVPTIPSDEVEKAWLKRFGPLQPLPSMPNFGPHKFCNTGKWFPEDNVPVVPTKLSKHEEDTLSIEWVAKMASKLNGPVVDDRLGCALALGCTAWADILFTDCEEIGQSTAGFFQAPRAYNWIIGFDRRGTDVVTYDYKDKDWLSALGGEFTVGNGSFSDIGYLENLATACVNMGVGYYNEHTVNAHWKPKDTEEQFARLYKFWSTYGDTAFNHIPPKKVVIGTPGRHEGVTQTSLHGREWLSELEPPKPAPLANTFKYSGPTYYTPFDYRAPLVTPTESSKSVRSVASTSPSRFEQTNIPGTVWDNEQADYRSLAEVDWNDQDVIDFVETMYPEFLSELHEYKTALDKDVPIDPLAREFGGSYGW